VQTATPPEVVSVKHYLDSENEDATRLASTATQAARYGQALALASCQSSVAGLFLFHAFDDRELDRWQSGIYYVDGTPKRSFAAVSNSLRAAGTRDVSSCPPSGAIP